LGFGCWDEDEVIGLDPLGGVEDEAGNDGADVDLGGVRWSLDDDARELVVTRVLPFGDDLNAVADLKGFGAAAWDGLVHDCK
jgi:hypothetical protein